MTPSSSGSRSPSRAAGGNSPSSSRKSTPPWLRLISPGRSVAEPPPTRRDGRGRVVRRAERRRGDQAARRHRQPGGRVNHRGRQRLGPVERREQARQPLGEHRLARPGRADHQQVVAAGGGDLQRPAGHGLAADVGEVGQRRRFGRRRGGPGSSGHGASPVSASDDLGQRRGDAHVALGGARAPRQLRRRGTTTSTSPSTATIGATPGTRRSVPSRPSSPRNASSSDERLGHLAGCDEDADGDRQVEAGTDLARARRRQVDRDALVRPLEAGAHHGGADAVARLAARTVGLADDAVAGQALADVDLDGHRVAAGSEQAGGRDGSEHDGLPRHGRWIEGGAATAPRRRGPDGTGRVSQSHPDCAGRRRAAAAKSAAASSEVIGAQLDCSPPRVRS